MAPRAKRARRGRVENCILNVLGFGGWVGGLVGSDVNVSVRCGDEGEDGRWEEVVVGGVLYLFVATVYMA